MASIDSGVDTGNDSNDSFAQDKNLVAQSESQSLDNKPTILDNRLKDFIGNCGKYSARCVRKNFICSDRLENCSQFSSFQLDPPAGLSFLHVQPLSLSRGYEIAFQRLNTEYQNSKLINKLKPLNIKSRLTTRHLLNDSKSLLDFTTARDENRLRLAAFMNDAQKVRQYLEAGVNPNCPDCQLRTPLHLSACNGYTEIVKLLLDHGANPNVKDMVGNTPLHLAVCTNHIDVVTLLLKAVIWSNTNLHLNYCVNCDRNVLPGICCSNDFINKMFYFCLKRMFYERGTDASCYNITGRSPLQLAQSKLKIIQRSQDSDYKHQVTSQVIDMLLAFIKKKTEVTKNTVDEELLNAFQSRLQVSETQEQVENELQNLLDNLSSLSLSNPSSAATTSTT